MSEPGHDSNCFRGAAGRAAGYALSGVMLLVTLAICLFWTRSDNEHFRQMLEHHCDVIASDVWNLDPSGPIEYLTLAAHHGGYADVKILLPDGELFLSIEGEAPSATQEALITLGWIYDRAARGDIVHDGETIGQLSIRRRIEHIFPCAYIVIVMALLYAALMSILRVLGANRALEDASDRLELRVKVRTRELESTISLLKRAEQEVSGVQQRLQSIMDNATALIFVKDLDGRYLTVNQEFLKLHEWREEDVLGRTDAELFTSEIMATLSNNDQKVLEAGQALEFVEQVDRRGELRVYSTVKFPLADSGGRVTAICGMSNDITDRQQQVHALQKSEERFRRLYEALGDAVFVTQADGADAGLILEVNRAAEEQTGYSREELLGKNIISEIAIGSKQGPELHQVLEDLLGGKVLSFTEQKRKKNGETYWTEVVVTPVEYKGRKAGLSINHDITERRNLEEQLRQSQKMEAVGRLAGGVAHDFNNLLAVINGYCDLLSMVELDPKVSDSIQQIHNAGRRATGLTSQLLAFSRKQVVQPRVLDINGLIRNYLKMLGRLLGEDIAIDTQLESIERHIRIDPGQLEQVIMNSAINARDAMPFGGRITLLTRMVAVDQTFVTTHADVAPGEYVLLSITDSGIGMSEETVSSIFEPFFTTKGVDKGTGLGLSTVYGIVRQNDGFIKVSSELGTGSTFEYYFPCVDKPQDDVARRSQDQADLSGSETILLVEDDDAVRRVTRSVLGGYGYRIICAENGKEALRLFRESGERIDLLLTDVVMPLMSGPELAEQLGAIDPDLRVLYVSGYTDGFIAHHGVLDESIELVQKPYSNVDLARKVRELLD